MIPVSFRVAKPLLLGVVRLGVPLLPPSLIHTKTLRNLFIAARAPQGALVFWGVDAAVWILRSAPWGGGTYNHGP